MKRSTLFLQVVIVLMGSCSAAPTKSRSTSSNLVCNVRDFGAKADGTPDTSAIQAAVKSCQQKNGIVFFPAGNYTSGTIQLGSHMTFHLDSGATLTAIRDTNAFPLQNPKTFNSQLLNCRRALLYAENTDGLTIEGPGTIDGSGDFQDWQNVKEAQRPMAIFIVQSTDLIIKNLNVKNAAMWSVVLMETKNSIVSQLDVDSRNGNTRDGLDLVDGDNIHVEHLTVLSEDDSICLKSGIASGLNHVWISNSTIRGSLVANGLKFGTASVGALSDVHFENIDIRNVAQAAMALESVDGSQIKDVTFKNITYRNTGSAIFILLGWRGDQSKPHVGSISNIDFENISGESSKQAWGSAISGTQIGGTVYSPENIKFNQVRMKFKGDANLQVANLPPTPSEYAGQYPDPRMWSALPSQGLYFRHIKNITLKNTELVRDINSDARPVLLPHTGLQNFDAP